MSKAMGDDAFETIVADHHAEIHRYIARVTARASEADDLSQETFLRAYRAYRALAPGANVRAWLFAIATNLCKNHFRAEGRRRRAHVTVKLAGPRIEHDGPDGEAVFAEASARIDGIVTTLPLRQRLAFTMRKIHDLDYGAIGQSLGCSPDSARAHVFQALKKIRRGLDALAIPHTEPER